MVLYYIAVRERESLVFTLLDHGSDGPMAFSREEAAFQHANAVREHGKPNVRLLKLVCVETTVVTKIVDDAESDA